MDSLVDVVGAEHSFGPWFDTPLPRRGTSLATHWNEREFMLSPSDY